MSPAESRVTLSLMSHSPPGRKPATHRSQGKKIAAWIFAVTGLGVLAFSGYQGRQRYLRENPPPLPEVIAPIPPGHQEALRSGMRLVSKTLLRVSPEQGKQLTELWDKTPRSVDEVIEYQRRTDQILTPEQRARFKPLRQAFQNRIVDEMLEPARNRFPASDFEKFRNEVKNRVEERISGQ